MEEKLFDALTKLCLEHNLTIYIPKDSGEKEITGVFIDPKKNELHILISPDT